ncbi:MAG: hypothetical protein PHG94_03975 [Syntrophomonas sp.]|nr:hypothetical protein [Syntrophomonas sp.]
MQSAAPLFSKAIFYKNMNRFWPIFVAYTVILLLIGFSTVANGRYERLAYVPNTFANTIFGFSGVMPALIAIFSIMVAAAVFSYMYNPMSVGMINALPFKRRTVFTSNYLSGLFMLIVPLLLFFLSMLGIGLKYECLDMVALLNWLFIFFSLSLLLYSLAVIIGMLTGHIIAHIVFFVIANFLIIGLKVLTDFFLNRFLYGFVGTLHNIDGFFMQATPIDYASGLQSTYTSLNWTVWLVYLLLGVLFVWLAQILYKNRKMENAGDVLAIRKLNPVFKYGVTFCSTLALGAILIEVFNVQYSTLVIPLLLFLLAGLVGYLIAEMLLKKSFRVFGAYKGFVIYACLLIITSMSVYYDWYGYATRLPDADQVEAVVFSYNGEQYEALQTLQAEQNHVDLDISNLPESLALRYGTPESMQKDPDSNDYVYPESCTFTPEETRLLWSVYPGIYTEDESIDSTLKLHQYLADNIKTVRSNYRQRSMIKDYVGEEIQYFNISFIYRLDNGKIEKHNFQMIIPVQPSEEIDQKSISQLASLAGNREERVKRLAAIDLPLNDIRHITVDLYRLRDLMHDNLKSNNEVRRNVKYRPDKEYTPIEIRDEDKKAFFEAVKADYQNMSNEKMVRSQVLRYGEGDIGNFTLAIERSNLPQTNRFRDGRSTYGISVYYENTFRLLRDKGYITEDVYNFVNIHREMLDEKYSNQTAGGIVSIAYL